MRLHHSVDIVELAPIIHLVGLQVNIKLAKESILKKIFFLVFNRDSNSASTNQTLLNGTLVGYDQYDVSEPGSEASRRNSLQSPFDPFEKTAKQTSHHYPNRSTVNM